MIHHAIVLECFSVVLIIEIGRIVMGSRMLII
jgi:hypothetical protein